MDNTPNDIGSKRMKEDLKAWMETHQQEYGEMAMGMGRLKDAVEVTGYG